MNQALIVLGARDVTGQARHFFVSPTQGETTIGFVIKFFGKPIESDMTRGTINGLVVGSFTIGEFTLMNVVVTAGTIFCRAEECQLYLACVAGGFMASRAGRSSVAVFQYKFRYRMIEDGLTPGVLGMACRTPTLTGSAHYFFSLTQMWITMTVNTGLKSRRQINGLGVNRLCVDGLGCNARLL